MVRTRKGGANHDAQVQSPPGRGVGGRRKRRFVGNWLLGSSALCFALVFVLTFFTAFPTPAAAETPGGENLILSKGLEAQPPFVKNMTTGWAFDPE